MDGSAAALIGFIEHELQRFYDLRCELKAADFLLSRQALDLLLPRTGTDSSNPFTHERASLWLVKEADEELFLGLYFHDELLAAITAAPPLTHLNEQNLDAFCAVVEEVSHFHLI